MEKTEIQALIDHYTIEKKNGMDYSHIRKALESKNIDKEKINFIVRCIDKEILREEDRKTQNRKAKELILAGAIVSAIGLIVTVGSYSGLINTGDKFVLAYGPFLAGIGILLSGIAKYQKD